jgi:hypothetical protein
MPYQVPGPSLPLAPGRAALGLGIAGLVAGLAAASFIWVPLCGLAAYPIAGIGLALALAGVIVSLSTQRRQPLLLPLIGTLVCAGTIATGLVAAKLHREEQERNIAQAERERPAREAEEARQRQQIATDRAKWEADHPNWKEEARVAEIAAERARRPKDLPPYEITSNWDIERGLFKSSRTVGISASGDLTAASIGRILDYVSGQYPHSRTEIRLIAGGTEVASRDGDGKNTTDAERLKRYRQAAGLDQPAQAPAPPAPGTPQ